MSRIVVVLALILLCSPVVPAQTELLPLEHSLYNRIDGSLIRSNTQMHSSIQPYELRDVSDLPFDAAMSIGRIRDTTDGGWLYRRIYSEHLLEASDGDYRIYADFYPDFLLGKDVSDKRGTMLNTRGFAVGGNVTRNFSFITEFYENQAKFPTYLDAYGRKNGIVPGQGSWKPYGADAFDYFYSNAVLSYRPSQYLGIQGGQGKNFIGDGYRSMLLSDAAFNYPFLKLTADVWKLKYMALWAEFQDLRNYSSGDELPYTKKSGIFHYLDCSVTDRLNVGLFEAVIWLPQDSAYYRGIEWNYLNPLVFLRPVDETMGSPDNVLLGLNLKYRVGDRTALYGQFLIDEMTVSEFIAGSGYWANKYAVQLGVKSYEPFHVHGLFVQEEFNCASPYTYSHINPVKNYGHYGQSLADPLGANFYESVSIAEYSMNRFEVRGQVNVAHYGDDSSRFDYGKDIYKSYTTRPANYGVYIGQGVKTNLLFADLRVAYVLNPVTNLRLELGAVYRRLTTPSATQESTTVSFGLRGSFRNLYYDF